jgi:3-keto-disaccharide hydrolase
MKRHGMAAAAIVVALAGCAGMRIPGTGWETLVDGEKGMENFNQIGDANWRPEAGAIVADKGKAGFLVTKKSYGDFELRAEFYADTDTNSGIFIRCADPQKIGGATCYEVNIWDIRPEPKYGTGAIVDVAAVPVPIKNTAGGKWNTYEITAKGSQLTVRLNGVQTANAQDSKHASGPFALQMGPGVKGVQGGAIKWRKVQVRPL